MQYLLLIYEEEGGMNERKQGDPSFLAEYRALLAKLSESGELKAGDALLPTRTATTVRVRNGEALLTDGPFAETREQLGGYFLVDAANLDRALEIARQIPSARHGCIEVRPVWAPPA